MDTNLLTQPPESAAPEAPATSAEPLKIPEKFRDPETGELRVDLLLKSYLEMERRMSGMVELPGPEAPAEAKQRFRKRMGVPDRPEDYPIEAPNELIQPDPEVNRILHEAGFTPEQVQLVYNLAAERMIPAISAMGAEFEAERQLERLVEHFGGPEKWREVAGALAKWGRKNLPEEVFEALSSTFEGVLAIHRMMSEGEPGMLKETTAATAENEAELRRLMADPRYWRDRDPAVVKKVTEGFQRLFPGEG